MFLPSRARGAGAIYTGANFGRQPWLSEDQTVMDTGGTGSKTWHCRADVNNWYNAKHPSKLCGLIYTGIKR